MLKGAKDTLQSPELKHIFIEIHFTLLEQRGMPDAASLIKTLLEDNKFQVMYTDFSHIHAFRP